MTNSPTSTQQKLQRFRRATLIIAWLLAAVAVPLYALKVHQKTDYMDFDVYFKAAQRLLAEDWENIYTLKDGSSPFRYAPPILPWLAPLAEFSRDSAKMLFFGFQVICFAGTFAFIYFTLRAISRPRSTRRNAPSFGSGPGAAGWSTALAFLFVLRLCLDTFTIGQITPVLLVLISGAAWAWTTRFNHRAHTGLSAALLVPPALIKIGPAVLFGVFLSSRMKQKIRAALAALVTLWLLVRGGGLWLTHQGADLGRLWSLWWVIVREDDRYYDASHYGSQSLKSALLRLTHLDWISVPTAQTLYVAGVLIGCVAVAAFWSLRRPQSLQGRALLFASGLFPYFWLMPETFKYSLTPLALPVALLFSLERKTKLTKFSLLFGFLTISIAGMDVIGDWLFFGLQRASMPFLATLLLGAACFVETWKRTRPSALARWLSRLLARPGIAPWRKLPSKSPACQLSILIPLSMDRASSLHPGWITLRTAELIQACQSSLPQGTAWEAIFIPFGDRVSRMNPLWSEVQAQCGDAGTARRIRLLDPDSLWPETATGIEASLSRGLALREGFLEAQGSSFVAFWNLEQPCDPVFFGEAIRALRSTTGDGEFHLVRANRRHPESRFQVPVRHLSLVFSRHRLGLAFNELVRAVLPIQTTDTHSGSLLMTRALAERAFALQTSPHFLFDLELSLIARGAGWEETDLPVTTRLPEEKRARRMLRETLTIAASLPRLARREKRGFYGSAWNQSLRPFSTQRFGRITADDWGISPGVNHGILDLVRAGVVRRTSLMARSSFLTEGLPELLALRDQGHVELGLHYDLTFGKSSPGRVLLGWIRARLSGHATLAKKENEARRELHSQLEALATVGVKPTYLDGHHHIHLVPGLLEAIAEPLKTSGIRQVRIPYDPALWRSPRFPLALLAWRALHRVARLGLKSHPCFYPAFGYFLDPGRMRAALTSQSDAEVIVHPAKSADFVIHRIPDDYSAPRVTEYRALWMQSFLERAEQANPADSKATP